MLPWTGRAGPRPQGKRSSPAPTVPILVLDDGEVINDSSAIAKWANPAPAGKARAGRGVDLIGPSRPGPRPMRSLAGFRTTKSGCGCCPMTGSGPGSERRQYRSVVGHLRFAPVGLDFPSRRREAAGRCSPAGTKKHSFRRPGRAFPFCPPACPGSARQPGCKAGRFQLAKGTPLLSSHPSPRQQGHGGALLGPRLAGARTMVSLLAGNPAAHSRCARCRHWKSGPACPGVAATAIEEAGWRRISQPPSPAAGDLDDIAVRPARRKTADPEALAGTTHRYRSGLRNPVAITHTCLSG